ncbi:hypothetical protein ES703_60639 [subsurface metagenome]
MITRPAVNNAFCSGRVVSHHTADGGLAAGGWVGCKEKSVRGQLGVEHIKNYPRLDSDPAILEV